MKCSNCGTELNENEKFCTVCGQPVNGGQPMNTEQSADPGQAGSQMQAAGCGQDRKKKQGLFNNKIIIAAAVICVLVLGAVAGAKVFKKSPTEYYQYVETKNRDGQIENLTQYYDSVCGGLTRESFNYKVNMKLTLSDSIKSLATLYGVDLSNLDNIELNTAVKKEKDAYSSLIKAGGNGEGILTLKTHYDLGKKDCYVQIPELSEAYIHASMDSPELEGNRLYSYADFGKMIPSAENLEKIYKRYTDILIKSAQNVEKAKEQSECEAEGVSCKADVYAITMKGKEAASLADEIFKQLKEDDEIKNLIKNFDEKAGDEYEEEIAEAIENLEGDGNASDLSIVMEVMIGRDDKIIGRNIKIKDKDTGDFAFRIMCPRDGENFALEVVLESEGKEILKLHGKGTEKDNIINGDFAVDAALDIDSDNYEVTKNALKVILEEYDVSNLKEGEVRGAITYSTEAAAEFANYSIKVEAEGNKKESTGIISILAGQEAVATIDMKMERDVDIESIVPSGSDTVYEASDSDAMSKYQSEIDVMQLLQKVQNTLGIDFSSLMELM